MQVQAPGRSPRSRQEALRAVLLLAPTERGGLALPRNDQDCGGLPAQRQSASESRVENEAVPREHAAFKIRVRKENEAVEELSRRRLAWRSSGREHLRRHK